MTITSNVHGATRMEAQSRFETSWLKIHTKHGEVVVFMPAAVAEATARAFNMAQSYAEEGALTLADFVPADTPIKEHIS